VDRETLRRFWLTSAPRPSPPVLGARGARWVIPRWGSWLSRVLVWQVAGDCPSSGRAPRVARNPRWRSVSRHTGRVGSRRGGGCGENLFALTSSSPHPPYQQQRPSQLRAAASPGRTPTSRDRHRTGGPHARTYLAERKQRVLARCSCLAAAINLNHQPVRPKRAAVNYCAKPRGINRLGASELAPDERAHLVGLGNAHGEDQPHVHEQPGRRGRPDADDLSR